jgi:hypothetical protein
LISQKNEMYILWFGMEGVTSVPGYLQLQFRHNQRMVPSQIILHANSSQVTALFLPELFEQIALTSSYCTYICPVPTSDDVLQYYSNRLHACRQITVHHSMQLVRSSRIETRFPFPIFSPATPFVCVMSSSFIWSVCPLDPWTHAHTLVNSELFARFSCISVCMHLNM